ncbi:MAG: hypothetical protein JXJ17_18240 [Anaerolineae bacterium]|nr:hypothetical protein [Anaerolineae bacterium]
MRGLYEEYQSLRTEIAQKQNARLYILAFTVAANGTIISSLLGDRFVPPTPVDLYALALISLSIGMLIVAELLTIQSSQQIRIIAEYIRVLIEPNDRCLQWEAQWKHFREHYGGNKMPTGASKPLAIFYGFLTISVYLISYVTRLHTCLYAIAIVSVLGLISLCCSLDLYFRKTHGWKVRWFSEEE